MVICTLKDSGPTTTITFKSFTKIERKGDFRFWKAFAYPENEGTEIIFEGAYIRFFSIRFTLANDDTYPSSGKSASDKRADLENLLFTGGDNAWKFRLTFDSEDSTSGSPQTEYYDGYIKNWNIPSISGKDIKTIKGSFDLWESTI